MSEVLRENPFTRNKDIVQLSPHSIPFQTSQQTQLVPTPQPIQPIQPVPIPQPVQPVPIPQPIQPVPSQPIQLPIPQKELTNGSVDNSTNQQSIDPVYFDTVVQVHTFSPDFNPLAPFQTGGTRKGWGTGFFVSPTVIMTAAHVVSGTYDDIGVKFTVPSLGINKLFGARVITYIPEIDIALLVSVDPDLPPRTKYFKFGNDKALVPGRMLTVVGFPLGANRLKVHNSTFNGLQDGVIQIDSSINQGNSGGPVLSSGMDVVGIVSSGFDPRVANSVAFAIPIGAFLATMSMDPLKVTPQPRVLQLPSLGIMYHNGTPGAQLIPDCQEGVNVQWVSKNSSLYNTIHPGDKLCAIIVNDSNSSTEYKIDNVGDVNVSWYYSKIPLPHAISLIPVNTPIQVRYWDSQTKTVKTVSTTLKPVFTGAFRPIYYPFEPFDYESFGGLVVSPLRSIHLMIFKHLYFKLSPDEKEKNHLVVTYVFPNSTMAQTGIMDGGEILSSVNGRRVETLDEYRDALLHPQMEPPSNTPHIEWITQDHEKVDLPLRDLLNEEPVLRKEYKLAESKMFMDLKTKYP
jgi:S1-C subfamily serine protease